MDKHIGDIYKDISYTTNGRLVRIYCHSIGNRYFMEVLGEGATFGLNKKGLLSGCIKNYPNIDQLKEDVKYVNWPLDEELKLAYTKIKPTELAKKMYPDAKEKYGWLRVKGLKELYELYEL